MGTTKHNHKRLKSHFSDSLNPKKQEIHVYIEIDQAPIYVNIEGKGEDALLLHGVPDSAEIWNSLIDKIKGQYTCHAPDLPGFYRSGIPENYIFDFDHYADFIDAMVTELKLSTPLTLVIHDWGGIYGMLWACKYPHKVKRIVGGDFPFSHLYKWHEWATIWRKPVLGELSMLLMNWPLFKWEFKRSSRRLSVQDMKDSYHGKVTQWRTRNTVLKMYRSADTEKFLQWSSRQKNLADSVPIELIWGEDDPYVQSQQATHMHPRSVTVIKNCGHWPPKEAPEEYSQVLLKQTQQAQLV
jgi:pimeloyl-ACP methyl ester carboxylesterase